MQNTLKSVTSPQLRKIHSGKVRDSLALDKDHRLLVASDRLSCFDRALDTPIANKGQVLTAIAKFWFEKTQHIVDNHFCSCPDPSVSLVKEAQAIPLEIIVRKYLTGSIWRRYEKGEREFSGVKVPDGMKKNQAFPKALITPTTKEKIDRPITPQEIVKQNIVSAQTYEQILSISHKLFEFGTQLCKEKGLVLVDTKYEFGFVDNKLVLIDELHTPDSSRFWHLESLNDTSEKQWLDKEYVRQWLLANKVDKKGPLIIPEDVQQEVQRRYQYVYEKLLDKEFKEDTLDPHSRLYHNLRSQNHIRSAYVVIAMGSSADLSLAEKIAKVLKTYDVMIDIRVVSAHKNGEQISQLADEYNNSIEPGCAIAIAGRSNGLGGALAANLNIPVISCPPWKDTSELNMNINSSLMMPSMTPAMTVVYPDLAAHAAVRALNVKSLREQVSAQIQAMKDKLSEADQELRSKSHQNYNERAQL